MRVEQAIETRAALIKVARRLFAEKGYHAAGTHEVVAIANITRGALYHHFKRKEDLFLAVFQEVRREWIRDATASDHGTEDRWQRLREHIKLFIRAARTPDVHRIVMVDGPAVLGWKEWRDIQTADGLTVISEAISDGIAAGTIRPQQPEVLVHLVISLIEEGALLVTHADDQESAIQRVETAIDTLLSNLR
jgi:AcrR family transcriptional regulator